MENINNPIEANATSEQPVEYQREQNNNAPDSASADLNKPNQRYTLEYVLEQIEKLSKPDYMQGIHGAPNLIASLDEGGQEAKKPRAIAETIKAREQTNRELIAFYKHVYDDLKPKQPDAEIGKLGNLIGLANNNPDVAERIGLYDTLEQAVQQILLFSNLR